MTLREDYEKETGFKPIEEKIIDGKEIKYWHGHYVEWLETRLQDSITKAEELKKYVNHTSGCWKGQPKHEEIPGIYDCTCGLDKLLEPSEVSK